MDPRGRILVVSQRGNSWSLPKGHVDPGESLEGAARREILEESGVRTLSLVRALGYYSRPRIGKRGGEDRSEVKVIHMFLFRTRQRVLKPRDPHHPEALWMTPDAAGSRLTHPRDRRFLRAFLRRAKRRSVHARIGGAGLRKRVDKT